MRDNITGSCPLNKITEKLLTTLYYGINRNHPESQMTQQTQFDEELCLSTGLHRHRVVQLNNGSVFSFINQIHSLDSDYKNLYYNATSCEI